MRALHLIAVAAALALLLLVGCTAPSVSPAKPGIGSVELAAYTSTVHATSAHLESMTTYRIAGRVWTMTSGGNFSWSTDRGRFMAKTSLDGGLSVTSEDLYDGAHSYFRYVLLGHSGVIPHPFGLGSGDGWTEATWTSRRPVSPGWAILGQFAGQWGVVSPAVTLRLLTVTATSVADLGPQSVDTVAATHYRASIPLTALGPPQDAAEIEQARRAFGSDHLMVDFWVDSSRLLRRLSWDVRVNLPALGGNSADGPPTGVIRVSATVRLSDFGVRVEVIPPPPSQVIAHATCEATSDGFTCQS